MKPPRSISEASPRDIFRAKSVPECLNENEKEKAAHYEAAFSVCSELTSRTDVINSQ